MKKFIRKYRTLFILFCISLVAVLLINFPLSSIEEFFQYGSEIGKFIYDISIGYMVSYFFFYLVVFLKEEKDKGNVSYRASLRTRFIIIDAYSLYSSILEVPIVKLFPPSLEKIHEACLKIDPFVSPLSTTGSDNRRLPWSSYLKLFRKTNLEYLEKIISLPYLDSELFGILIRIEDCRLFFIAERRIFPSHKTEDFYDGTFMEKELYEYFQMIHELEIYVNKHYKEYVKHAEMVATRKKHIQEFYQ